MARNWYGGDQAAIIEVDGVVGANDLAQLFGNQQTLLWNLQSGGVQITDLLDPSDAETDQTMTSDGTDGYTLGIVLPFQGPDGYFGHMWASVNGGPRFLLAPWSLGTLLAPRIATLESGLDVHKTTANAHGTSVADLADVEVPAPEDRTAGHVLAWVPGTESFGLQAPAEVAGALMLNPPLVGGAYVGNIGIVPPAGPGAPWLHVQQPYSGDDDNRDFIVLSSTTSGGTEIEVFRLNGNMEPRAEPSRWNRVALRVFEYAAALGSGASTQRFFELSTNPTDTNLREPLLGAYGTAHSTQPGWIVATRVLAGLLGVRAGGSYNGLTAVNFRGRSAVAGAPTASTWITGDLVIDSTGVPWLCTAGGTPGTWAGAAAPTAYVDITPGTNMAHGTKHAASRLERGGDSTRLRGTLTASATVTAGAVVATIPTAGHRPLTEPAISIARYTGGGSQIQIATNGQITLGSSLSAGQSVWLDALTYDLVA